MEFKKVFLDHSLTLKKMNAKIASLLDNGADPNEMMCYKYKKSHPFVCSAMYDATGKLVRKFLDMGVDVNITDVDNRTALLSSVGGVVYETTDDRPILLVSRLSLCVLTEYGADVNYTGYTTTALHLAKEKLSIEILLEAGADVAAKNRLGRTPLDIFLLRLDDTYAVHEVEFIMCLDLLIEAI